MAVKLYNLGIDHHVPEHKLGVDARTVSRWELGKAEPNETYTALLSLLYQLPPEQLDLPPLVLPVADTSAKVESVQALAVPAADSQDVAAFLAIAAELDGNMKRRTFARFLALTGGLGALRPDVLATVFDGSSGIDEGLADRLVARSLQYMAQWDRLPPHVLLSAVIGHMDEIQLALSCTRSQQLARRLRVIISETAAFAGMLGWFLQDRGLAEISLCTADDNAQAVGHASVQAIVSAIRADFHSFVQLGRPIGSAVSRSLLEAAELAIGKTPSPVRAWILMRQAEEYAVIGQEKETGQRLDLADTSFANLPSVPPGMFGHWSPDMHSAFRGNCEQLLGRYNSSIDILTPVFARIDPAAVSNRISLQADMAAVHARQGDPERASELLASSLEAASQAGLRERIKRVAGIRSNLLVPFDTHPAVRRLDDQLNATLSRDEPPSS